MRKILSCKFNLDTACVELRLDDLQRSAGLCGADFEWKSQKTSERDSKVNI